MAELGKALSSAAFGTTSFVFPCFFFINQFLTSVPLTDSHLLVGFAKILISSSGSDSTGYVSAF